MIETSLTLTPIKILFEKEFFVIFATKEGVSIKGETIENPKNLLESSFVFHGSYENHPKYGDSFHFIHYERQEGELFSFLTTMIKGVSEKIAISLIEKFGDNLPFVIENEPHRLLTISGIKEKKLSLIMEGWKHFSHLKTIANFLYPYHVGNSVINKIYTTWGEEAIDILRKSPYKLTEIYGIGFKKADEIARKLGVSVSDQKRLESGILFSIDKLMSNNGHTLVKQKDVSSISIDILEVKEENWKPTHDAIEQSLTSLFHHGEIMIYDQFLILKKFDMMEKYILTTFKTISQYRDEEVTNTESESHISMMQEKEGIVYAHNQIEAIKMATSGCKCMIIAGYAGAGKSTVAKAIFSYFITFIEPSQIIGCALSGVAANRIKQTSGCESVTLHSLLGYSQGGFTYHKNNTLPYKVILLDESSMVDTEMFYRLLQAIDFDMTTLVMLGDPAQLPPVSPGGVFGTLLHANILPFVVLDKIYRQSEDDAIVAFANEVRQGNVPEKLTYKGYRDFVFIPYPDCSQHDFTHDEINQAILRSIIKMGEKIALKLKNIDPCSWEYMIYFQMITPMREGVLGVKNLNLVLQPLLNPCDKNKVSCKIGGKTFRTFDKIIHLSNKNMQVVPLSLWKGIQEDNDYPFVTRRVYNGQMGVLFHCDENNDEMIVFYPNDKYYVFYSLRDFMDGLVDHAFAMTIHKSQGSEFENVVLPISSSHRMMLSTKLLYTAMTRAKTKLVVVGEVPSFYQGVRRHEHYERHTLLSWLSQKGEIHR